MPATRACGLEGLRFHDLRHTAGTLSAQTGATTKEIMARLGHASPRASMISQHATSDRDRLIAERLADMTVAAGLAQVLPFTQRDQMDQMDQMARAEREEIWHESGRIRCAEAASAGPTHADQR